MQQLCEAEQQRVFIYLFVCLFGRYGLKIESPILSHQARFTILIDFFPSQEQTLNYKEIIKSIAFILML